MKVIVHPLFVVVLVVAWWLGFGVFMLAVLGAIVVHELCHAWAARYFGVRAREIRLLPFGAEVSIDCRFLSTDKKILILLAGAFGNIVVAVVCGSLIWLFPNLFMFLEIVIIANFVPAILNLLPIYPLDGGKILSLVLRERTIRLVKVVTNVVLGVALFGLALFYFNIPLLLFVVVMILTVNFELKRTCFESKIGIEKKGKIVEVALTRDMTLLQVFKMVSARHYTKFILTNSEISSSEIGFGKVSFYESDLERLLIKHNIDKRIGEVLELVR